MLLDEAGEILEVFRSSFPISFLFILPIIFMISPVYPATDFTVYRMQQYDLQGSARGCRSTLVNIEARPLSSAVYTRRCIVAKLKELTIDKFRDILQQNAGALLILLPNNLDELQKDDKEHFLELEQDLLLEDVQVPVYFTHETQELNYIYEGIGNSGIADAANSAFDAIFSSANLNGYQLVVNGPNSKALNDFEIVNLQGKLPGLGVEERLTSILVVAHYDSFGIAPSLSFGCDSNGSGVVALLELVRLFSKLYANSRSQAKYNLIFLLTGAGKYNYHGTKRWLEEQTETGELNQVNFVICLDTIGSGEHLYAHVSKPPREGTVAGKFIEDLERLTTTTMSEEEKGEDDTYHQIRPSTYDSNDDVNPSLNGLETTSVEDSGVKEQEQKTSNTVHMNTVHMNTVHNKNMVHKKINLAEDYLAWEHERFSIQRMSALTLSRLNGFKSELRSTVLDRRSTVNEKVLKRNIGAIAESLARHLYNITDPVSGVFDGALDVDENFVSSWLDYTCSQARSSQLIKKDSRQLAAYEQFLGKYLKDVRRHVFKADKRDPEVIFYNGADFIMSAYSIKPAIFDLFLGLVIAAYLVALYFLSLNIANILSFFRMLTVQKASISKKNY